MDGILVINKEKDYTSRDIVNIVGKTLHTKKVGHTGTLDPLATGVLVVGVGKATKIFELLFQDEKEYIAEVKLGIQTDTLDITGTIEEQKEVRITKEQIEDALNHFKGSYLQEVPKYSAVKVQGKKMYEYAREKKKIELPKRMVDIKEIELLSNQDDIFRFRCKVSKGTYIRSLIRDIGKYLDIPCTMNNLIRTKQGIFTIDQACSIEDIKEGNYSIIPIKDALKNYKQVEVDENLKFKICNGQKLKKIYQEDYIVFLYKDNVIAIYQKTDTHYKPYKVLETW